MMTKEEVLKSIPHERALELLNKLIDKMCEDEGGHGHRVCEQLVDMGFSAEELLALSFPQGDIDDAMQEKEENDDE